MFRPCLPGSWLLLAAIMANAAPPAFGMLILGSPDPTRYSAEMGTEFLQRIDELAGAARA